jgi:ankyrin repeat protein
VAADIETRLGALPATLEGSYWEIYQEIQESGEHAAALADLAFQWLMYAQKTLTTDVFACIASSTLPSGTASGFEAAEVIDVCANLIISRNGAFEFAHLSVREFLEGAHKRNVDKMLPVHGNAAIAIACLRHLHSKIKLALHKPKNKAASDKDTKDEPAAKAVFYAAQYWIHHVCQSGDMRQKDPLANLIKTLLVTEGPSADTQWIVSGKFQIWCQIMKRREPSHHQRLFFSSMEFDEARLLQDSFASPPNPIWLACLYNWPEVVEFLYAAKHKDIDAPRSLHSFSIPDANPGAARDEQLSPLWYAILSRQLALIEIISSHCPSTLQRSNIYTKVTPLVQAARNGDEECTKIFLRTEHRGLAAEAEAEAKAFSAAAGNGHLKILEMLLAHNGKLLSTAGSDAMCRACTGGHTDVVTFLLDLGVPTDRGMEFLYLAVPTHGLLNILLERGIGLGGLSKALTLSVSEDYKESTALLLSHGAKKEPAAVTRSVKEGCRNTAIRLIQAGYDFSGRYLERRRAPLHYAAEQGYQDVAVALLSAGAPATTYDRDRNTPLHFAAARGHNGCVELLLSGGADVLAEDAEGRVPLDLAEMRRHESTEAIIRNWMTKLMEELQREKHMSRTAEMDKEQGGEVELVGDHNLL